MQFISVEQLYDITALLATYWHKYKDQWLMRLRYDLQRFPLSQLMANVESSIDIGDMTKETALLYEAISKIGGRIGLRRSLNAFITFDRNIYKEKLEDSKYKKLLQYFSFEYDSSTFLIEPPSDAPLPTVNEVGTFLGIIDALVSRVVPFAVVKDEGLHVSSLFLKTFINLRDLGLLDGTSFGLTRLLIHNEQPLGLQAIAEALQHSGPYLSSFDVILVLPEFHASYEDWQIMLNIIDQAGIPILFIEGQTLEPFVNYLTHYITNSSSIVIMDPHETKKPWIEYLINFRNRIRTTAGLQPKLESSHTAKIKDAYIRSSVKVIKNMEKENLFLYIRKQFFEQDDIVTDIINWLVLQKQLALRESLSRPLSLLFVGITGTGKTYLSKLLIDYFDVPHYTIHGSLFSEHHTIRILLGAPPSYVGFGMVPEFEKFLQELEGTNQFPSGVLVIDEAEKMCLEVVNRILVPLLDGEGIQFADDKHIVPKNLIVIATANGDAAEIMTNIGFEKQDYDNKKMVVDAIERYMTPEVLARFTASYLFKPLSTDALFKIAVREFNKYAGEYYDNNVETKLKEIASSSAHAREVERAALMLAFSILKEKGGML